MTCLDRTGDQRIVDLQFENTELVKDEEDGKTSRLDVLVFTSAGEESTLKFNDMTIKICPNVCFSTGQDCSLLRLQQVRNMMNLLQRL